MNTIYSPSTEELDIRFDAIKALLSFGYIDVMLDLSEAEKFGFKAGAAEVVTKYDGDTPVKYALVTAAGIYFFDGDRQRTGWLDHKSLHAI